MRATTNRLSDAPEIGIFTHRWHPCQIPLLTSIARHTRGSYALIMVNEPGSCAENMNRVLRRSRSKYLVLVDEDVQFLDDDWLRLLIQTLESDPAIGVVGCGEVKDREQLERYLALRQRVPASSLAIECSEQTWVPAYVTCYAMTRSGDFLSFDEGIPGRKGMTDVDACCQLRARGLKVVRDHRVAVYHPHKPMADPERDAQGFTTLAEERSWFPAQVAYMRDKWGPLAVEIFGPH